MTQGKRFMNIIRQGLLDCGCSLRECEEFEELASDGRRLCFLRSRRQEAMDDLRRAQKQVDCIDYLIREIGKQ